MCDRIYQWNISFGEDFFLTFNFFYRYVTTKIFCFFLVSILSSISNWHLVVFRQQQHQILWKVQNLIKREIKRAVGRLLQLKWGESQLSIHCYLAGIQVYKNDVIFSYPFFLNYKEIFLKLLKEKYFHGLSLCPVLP